MTRDVTIKLLDNSGKEIEALTIRNSTDSSTPMSLESIQNSCEYITSLVNAIELTRKDPERNYRNYQVVMEVCERIK